MKISPKPYSAFQRSSAVFMMIALLWLTLSLPVVYQSQEDQAMFQTLSADTAPDNNEEESNPLSNSTEEKNPNSNNTFSEEYLHNHHSAEHLFLINSRKFRCENTDTYLAFHGELHVPPPDIA